MLRKHLLTLSLAVTGLAQVAETIDVYCVDPNCGCCKAWISHLRRDNGFTVNDHVEPNWRERRHTTPGVRHA